MMLVGRIISGWAIGLMWVQWKHTTGAGWMRT